MRKNKKLKIVLVISMALISICYVNNVRSTGISVMPARISIYDALKGSNYIKQITIYNSGEAAVNISLTSAGDLASWVAFYNADNLTKQIKNITVIREVKVIIMVEIPDNIPNGFYNGSLYVTTCPQKQGGNTSHSYIILSFPVEISLSVTGTQMLSGNITTIETTDVEMGDSVLIHIGFINTGNVIAIPEVEVNISKGGMHIDNFVYSDTWIPVGSGGVITVEWSTANREQGRYDAEISVLLDKNTLSKQDLSFEIFPRGTFKRAGELISLTYEGIPLEGNVLTILAEFENTGQIETEAKFMAEVYKDANLIGVIDDSEEPIVNVWDSYTFRTYYKLEEIGEYEIQGYVIYENNKTSVKTLKFEVTGQSENVLSLVLIILLVTIVVIGFFYFKMKKNRSKI